MGWVKRAFLSDFYELDPVLVQGHQADKWEARSSDMAPSLPDCRPCSFYYILLKKYFLIGAGVLGAGLHRTWHT